MHSTGMATPPLPYPRTSRSGPVHMGPASGQVSSAAGAGQAGLVQGAHSRAGFSQGSTAAAEAGGAGGSAADGTALLHVPPPAPSVASSSATTLTTLTAATGQTGVGGASIAGASVGTHRSQPLQAGGASSGQHLPGIVGSTAPPSSTITSTADDASSTQGAWGIATESAAVPSDAGTFGSPHRLPSLLEEGSNATGVGVQRAAGGARSVGMSDSATQSSDAGGHGAAGPAGGKGKGTEAGSGRKHRGGGCFGCLLRPRAST